MWGKRRTGLCFAFVWGVCVFLHSALQVESLSDQRRCADPNCQSIISLGTAKINYSAGEKGMVSFKINSLIRIKSKSAGSDPRLWGIEVNGREGYAPKEFIKETKIYISDKKLKHIVPVMVPSTQPELKASEGAANAKADVELTTTAPLSAPPAEPEEVPIVTAEDMATAGGKPQEISPVQRKVEVVDGTEIPVLEEAKAANDEASLGLRDEEEDGEYDNDDDEDSDEDDWYKEEEEGLFEETVNKEQHVKANVDAKKGQQTSTEKPTLLKQMDANVVVAEVLSAAKTMSVEKLETEALPGGAKGAQDKAKQISQILDNAVEEKTNEVKPNVEEAITVETANKESAEVEAVVKNGEGNQTNIDGAKTETAKAEQNATESSEQKGTNVLSNDGASAEEVQKSSDELAGTEVTNQPDRQPKMDTEKQNSNEKESKENKTANLENVDELQKYENSSVEHSAPVANAESAKVSQNTGTQPQAAETLTQSSSETVTQPPSVTESGYAYSADPYGLDIVEDTTTVPTMTAIKTEKAQTPESTDSGVAATTTPSVPTAGSSAPSAPMLQSGPKIADTVLTMQREVPKEVELGKTDATSASTSAKEQSMPKGLPTLPLLRQPSLAMQDQTLPTQQQQQLELQQQEQRQHLDQQQQEQQHLLKQQQEEQKLELQKREQEQQKQTLQWQQELELELQKLEQEQQRELEQQQQQKLEVQKREKEQQQELEQQQQQKLELELQKLEQEQQRELEQQQQQKLEVQKREKEQQRELEQQQQQKLELEKRKQEQQRELEQQQQQKLELEKREQEQQRELEQQQQQKLELQKREQKQQQEQERQREQEQQQKLQPQQEQQQHNSNHTQAQAQANNDEQQQSEQQQSEQINEYYRQHAQEFEQTLPTYPTTGAEPIGLSEPLSSVEPEAVVDSSTSPDTSVPLENEGRGAGGVGSVEQLLHEPVSLPAQTPPVSVNVLEMEEKEEGLFATILGTVNSFLSNVKRETPSPAEEAVDELERILFPEGKKAAHEDSHYCEKVSPHECPPGAPITPRAARGDCEFDLTNLSLQQFLALAGNKMLGMSELLACLAIAAATSLFFLFGYYCFCNSSHEGALLSKLNVLERSLMATHKENAILKQDLLSTRSKLSSIEDNSFGSNDMVMALKKELEDELLEKRNLQEQVATLEKELENAAEAGLELNKIVSELLSNQSGDESIISSVEELQKQLNEQQKTIMDINANLAEKSRENSELQLMLAEQNARLGGEIASLQQDNDELEGEKSNLQTRLEDVKRAFEEDITKALEGKNFEIKRLQNEVVELTTKFEAEHAKLQTNQAKVEALEECLRTVRRDPNGNINQMIDVAHVRAELIDMQQKFLALKERFDTETDARRLAENQLEVANSEIEKLKQDFNKSEKDKLEAQTRLEVLSNYFKEKETQLQKELSLKEAMWLKQQGETTSTVDRLTTMQGEIQSLRSQNDALRAEIEAQLAAHKAQTGTLENRAHETWLAARQSERRCEEARAEASALRRRLTALVGTTGSAGEANFDKLLGGDLNNAPSPIHMESPGSPLLGRMPPFLPPPFMGPPPPFMGMPPPFVPPGEMRPPPLGRLMSPPPGAVSAGSGGSGHLPPLPPRSGRYSPNHTDYDDYDDDDDEDDDDEEEEVMHRRRRRSDVNGSWDREDSYSPPRTYRSHSPADSRYNYTTDRDLMSTYDTETDFSPPPSPRDRSRNRDSRAGSYRAYSPLPSASSPLNSGSKKAASATKSKGHLSSESDKSFNSPHRGKKSGKSVV